MRRQITAVVACLSALMLATGTAEAAGPNWTAPVTLAGHAGLGPGYADAGVGEAAIGANGTIAVTGYTGDSRTTEGRFQTWVVSRSDQSRVVETSENTLSLAFAGSTPFLLNEAFQSFGGAKYCCEDAYIRQAGASTVGPAKAILRDIGVFNLGLLPVNGHLLAVMTGTAGVSTTWRSSSAVWNQARVVDEDRNLQDFQAFTILSAAAGNRFAIFAGDSYLGTGAAGQPLHRLPFSNANGLSPTSIAIAGNRVLLVENNEDSLDPTTAGFDLVQATARGLVNQMTVPAADGLAQVAGDAQGDEIFVWQTCKSGCPLRAVFSRQDGPFSAPQTLASTGALDARAEMTTDGTAVVAWATEGHVTTSLLPAHADHFGPEDQITKHGLAEGNATPITLSAGANGNLLLTWQNATGNIELQRLREPSGLRG